MRTLVVTGYKSFELGIFKMDDERVDIIKDAIRKKLLSFIDEGLEWVLISGQVGFELWTAEVVLEMKGEGYSLCIGVIPPFEGQEERWGEDLVELYREVTGAADFYRPVYQSSYKGPYQFKAKDQFLVEHSDACLILYDEETKGSPTYFLNMAKSYQENQDYSILYITPFDLEEIAEERRMADPDYWST